MQAEVCSAQAGLEKLVLQLLQGDSKLISLPIQMVTAECLVCMMEYGDCRKLPETISSLLAAASSKHADASCRVYV
jgi:hypothetical protein